MAVFILKVIISAIVITFCSWLAGKKPELAGFIMALPLATLLALPFSHFEWQNPANTVRFARSIFVGIPVSLLFFVPFLLADRINLGFWPSYALGVLLLAAGFQIHRVLVSMI
ncbi:MAG: hypothetical protein RQ824_04570 [bacterium]|nr:hypothetical protein [bacterium]